MTRSPSIFGLGSEFDDFLFAPIGADRNDMPLSVLSALARLDMDPWLEAAELARLPRETATQRLASSIAAQPNGPSVHLEPGTIAARLIALLPRQASSKIPSPGTLPDAEEVTKFGAGMFMFLVFLAFMWAAQWIAASSEPPAQVDTTSTPASSTFSLEVPPPNSGQ